MLLTRCFGRRIGKIRKGSTRARSCDNLSSFAHNLYASCGGSRGQAWRLSCPTFPNSALCRVTTKSPRTRTSICPIAPSLEHLKGQAKTLLRDFLAGKSDGIRRVRRFMPDKLLASATPETHRRPALRLKDAQNILAREYTKGAWKFGSWEELKAHVVAVNQCSDALIVEQIGRLSRHPTPSLLNAGRFLGSLGSRLIPHLIYALKTHPDASVRCNCLGFLDHLNVPTDEIFVSAVAAALSDRVPRVRRSALHTLCCQRCKTVPLDVKPEHVRLIANLSVIDENSKVRAAAAGSLTLLAQQGRGELIKEALQEFVRQVLRRKLSRGRKQCLLRRHDRHCACVVARLQPR